jgi:intermediate cleaving peptidase 55
LSSLLPPLIGEASEVFTDISETKSPFAKFFARSNAALDGFHAMVKDTKVKPLKPLINDLRIIKSEAEVVNMRRVGKISGRAFTNAMRRQWHKEKDLTPQLTFQLLRGVEMP